MSNSKQEITVAVGKKIKYFRHLKSISQEALALKANLNPAYFGQVERGLKCPTIDTLYKIATALEIHPAELFHTQNTDTYTSYKSQQIAEKLSKLPTNKQEQIIKLIEDMLSLISGN